VMCFFVGVGDEIDGEGGVGSCAFSVVV